MKEVNLHYFVPESLEELVGLPPDSSVGIKMMCGPRSMTYMGEILDSDLGFIMQEVLFEENWIKDRPRRGIFYYRVNKEKISFEREYILITDHKLEVYLPHHEIYPSLLEALKKNNQWTEPKE
jgi:hypothetical protein